MMKLKVGDREIYWGKTFIIAEAGVNYYDIAEKEGISPLEAAKLMIEKAKEAGADAIKFQTYKAEKLASKFSPAYWDTTKEKTKSQYELFKKYDKFGEPEYRELARFANDKGIIFMSTPFDFESADFLDELMPVFKIASSDITNIPFIKHIARKGKPVFLSTGASNIEEIREAVQAIEEEGNRQIVIMHCILNYPTLYENANLGMILDLKKEFPDYLIGYSDHTLPDKCMIVLTTAVAFRASVIEKHFTLDKTLEGNDHYHSMGVDDLKTFVHNVRLFEKIVGKMKKEPLPSEENSRKYARRSLVAKTFIPKGAVIEKDMIAIKRPGTGIPPKYLDKVVGMKAKIDIEEDQILQWDYLEKAPN